MRVTRLEIFGFKSFMERLVLPLEGGVTGVVGPNGCGKSNVVDALRWVLGETRASNLRGGVLEDVIFNGTDKLRPLGLAEVTITLRASEKDLFADLVSPALEAEEFARSILREIEGGEAEEAPVTVHAEEASSEQAPEGSEKQSGKPQLKVIVGNKGSASEPVDELTQSLQGEGRAAAVSETESSDAAPEGAGDLTVNYSAGIEEQVDEAALELPAEEDGRPAGASDEEPGDPAGSDQKAEGEEKKSPSGNTLLTRFAWLKSVNEVQVTRRLYRSGESEFFINRVPCRLKDLKDLFRAVGLGARAYTIVAQGEVSRVVTSRPEDRRTILEEAAGVLGFRDKIASASRRLEDTAVNISRLDDVIKEVTRQVQTLKRQAARAINRQELKDRVLVLDRALMMDSLINIRKNEDQISQAETEFKRSEEEAEVQFQAAQMKEQAARNDMVNIDLQSDRLRSRMDSIREEISRRARQRSEKVSRINELKAWMAARSTEIGRLEDRKTTLSQRSAECTSEIEVLEAQDREISESMQGFEVGSEDELREIAARLDAQRNEYRRKEQVLRDARDRMIKSQSVLDSIKEQLISASPVTQLRKTLGDAGQELFDEGAVVRLFIDGLKVPAQYARAVQAVLAERTEYLLSDSPHELARKFVTNVLKDDPENQAGLALGVFRTGACDLGNANSDLLPRLVDLVQIEPEHTLAATECLGSVYFAQTLDQAIEFINSIKGAGLAAAELAAIRVVTSEGDILSVNGFYSLRHEGGIIQLKNRASELADECERLKGEYDALVEDRDQFMLVIQETETEHSEALRRSRDRQAKARELSNQQGNIRGRLQSAVRLAQQVEQDVARVVNQITEAQKSLEAYKDEEDRAQAELEALIPDEEDRLGEELEGLRNEWERVDEVRQEGRKNVSVLSQSLEEARRFLEQVRSRVSHTALARQKLELETQHVLERILTELGRDELMSMQQNIEAAEALSEETRASFQEELTRLKQRIIREGEVDPTSVERYEEENKRLEDLSRQKEDLDNAAGILKKTISRLTETSEQRFMQTFEAVSHNFSRLAPRLFGGGKAELTLTDPSKPLDSGVEIMARPPGKKPKSIDLLSGGEKALCATALIFAMFLERPSPLCVLDEVDAPLDEANLVRFLTLIKEMSLKTQFLMITHNKESMSMSDNLVGVTMQEPGASKVITVSLQEAVSQVA